MKKNLSDTLTLYDTAFACLLDLLEIVPREGFEVNQFVGYIQRFATIIRAKGTLFHYRGEEGPHSPILASLSKALTFDAYPAEKGKLLMDIVFCKDINNTEYFIFDKTNYPLFFQSDGPLDLIIVVPIRVGESVTSAFVYLFESCFIHEPIKISKLLVWLGKILSFLLAQRVTHLELYQLKKAVETMQLGVTISDLNGTILYVNQSEAVIHGYHKSDLLGKNIGIYAPRQIRRPMSREEIRNLTYLTRESVNIRKDGTLFPVKLRSDVVKDAQGEPIGIVTTCEDITHQKMTAEALSYRVELEKLVANISARFINLPLDTIDEALRSTLDTLNSFCGIDRSYVLTVQPETMDISIELVRAQITNASFTLPERITLPAFLPGRWHKLLEGEVIVIENVPHYFQKSDIAAHFFQNKTQSLLLIPLFTEKVIMGILCFESVHEVKKWPQEDIHVFKIVAEILANTYNRRTRELKVKRSEEKFRKLAETAPLAIFIIQKGRIVYCNQGFMNITGYGLDELIDRDISFLFDEDTARFVKETSIEKEQRQNEPSHYELQLVTKARKDCWVYLTLTGLEFEGSMACLGTAADITAQKRVEDQLRLFNEELEQKVKERTAELRESLQKEKELSQIKSRFVSLVSHEFRTPLTSIASSAEIIERYENKLTSEDRTRHLKRISFYVEEMKRMLDEVIFIGRTEAGKVEARAEKIDIHSFCREIVEDMKLVLGEERVIQYANVKGQKFISVDTTLLRHILTNIISNAHNYSAIDRPITIDLSDDGKSMSIIIEDEGIGIPANDIPKLFEAFHRAGNVGNRRGTGLGLAIVKRCADLIGARVCVKSQLHQGTRFIVSLPLTQ